MAIGFGLLHLSPSVFWSLTLREFEAACKGLFGEQASSLPLSPVELEQLMQDFPD